MKYTNHLVALVAGLLIGFTISNIRNNATPVTESTDKLAVTNSSPSNRINQLESEIESLKAKLKTAEKQLAASSNDTSISGTEADQNTSNENSLSIESFKQWLAENKPEVPASGIIHISGEYYDRIVAFGSENPEALLALYLDHPENVYLSHSMFTVFDENNSYLLLDHLDKGAEIVDTAIAAGLHEAYPQEFVRLFEQNLESNNVISTSLVENFSSNIINSDKKSKLEEYAITGYNKWHTIEAMANSGYENIALLATEAWEYDEGHAWRLDSYELIMSSYTAARYGNKQALEAFVNYYISDSSDLVDFSSLILKLFEDPFDVQDFNQNKALLVYKEDKKAWKYS